MPRISAKSQVLQDIQTAIDATTWGYLFASSSEEEDDMEEDLEDLLDIRGVIASQRYMSRGGHGSAGRHADDSLEAYIRDYPEDAFRRLFRMQRSSFWPLVELLTNAGGAEYWKQSPPGQPRKPARPIYQQIAAGLYMLGGGGRTVADCRVNMNIGHGTIWIYAWRTIELLARLLGEYVQWPGPGQARHDRHKIFRRCIGFLDGSIIILRTKPKLDPEAYFSRKKNYGFNLQAIVDWKGRFIWASMGHTASVHDSTAFKSTDLYRNAGKKFLLEFRLFVYLYLYHVLFAQLVLVADPVFEASFHHPSFYEGSYVKLSMPLSNRALLYALVL